MTYQRRNKQSDIQSSAFHSAAIRTLNDGQCSICVRRHRLRQSDSLTSAHKYTVILQIKRLILIKTEMMKIKS